MFEGPYADHTWAYSTEMTSAWNPSQPTYIGFNISDRFYYKNAAEVSDPTNAKYRSNWRDEVTHNGIAQSLVDGAAFVPLSKAVRLSSTGELKVINSRFIQYQF